MPRRRTWRRPESFDDRFGELDYAGPDLVAGLLRAARPEGLDAVLDLSCGTGLVGPVVRPLAQRLEGLEIEIGIAVDGPAD